MCGSLYMYICINTFYIRLLNYSYIKAYKNTRVKVFRVQLSGDVVSLNRK